jgi:hypothetical protein
MNHLSSLAQTLILFSTGEFGLVKLDDAYSTGSSMMPQKRNPDPLEVMKAKTSVAHGLLGSILSIGKALFLGYNRDTQWTKYLVMDLLTNASRPQLMGRSSLAEDNPEKWPPGAGGYYRPGTRGADGSSGRFPSGRPKGPRKGDRYGERGRRKNPFLCCGSVAGRIKNQGQAFLQGPEAESSLRKNRSRPFAPIWIGIPACSTLQEFPPLEKRKDAAVPAEKKLARMERAM